MSEIVNRRIVLSLNANWQAIGLRSVAEAFVAMNGGSKDNPPVKALDISYSIDKNGEYEFDKMPSIFPVSWVEWIDLPIREYDLVLNTCKYKIRVPTVIVALNYNKIPKKSLYPTKKNLYDFQRGICGLTGRKISWSQANIEHKIPKSKGGRNTWENLIVADRDINNARGNKDYSELGLKPLFNHKTPAPIPAQFTIKKLESLDWRWFFET